MVSQEVGFELQIGSLLVIDIPSAYFAALLGQFVGVLQTSGHSHSTCPVEVAVALVVGQFCQRIQGNLFVILVSNLELDWCAAAKTHVHTS